MSTEQESTRRPSIRRMLHRPSDEIADKPQLRVQPLVRADAVDEAPEPTEAEARAATIVMEPVEAAAVEALAGAEEEPAGGAAAGDAPVGDDPEPAEPDQAPMAEAPRKLARLPRIDLSRDPSLYATHGPAPADEAAEKAHLAAVTGQKAKEREFSTGFLLGVALIVLTLIGAVSIVHLEKRVQRLESRVSQLEQGASQTAALTPRPGR